MLETLPRCVLLLCAVALGGCGYASSPGMVVETEEYPLSEKATLIVARHLDDWRTGRLFTFEWYVVKCDNSVGPQIILMQDMVLRGTYSSEIAQERIHTADGKFGYAFFNEVVVFDKDCNKISHFDPWRTYVIDHSSMRPDYRINLVEIEESGRGLIYLSWKSKEGGVRNLKLRTGDFGVHWMLPSSSMDVREEVRVERPTDSAEAAEASTANFREITERLEKSEYVVVNNELVRPPRTVASTSLSSNEEFKILQRCLELAKGKGIGLDGDRVIIVDCNEYYEIIIGNPAKSRSLAPHYAYAAKVLVNKRTPVLAQWLSGN